MIWCILVLVILLVVIFVGHWQVGNQFIQEEDE